MRTWGIVSNCWQAQLGEGASLADLLRQAVDQGYQAIELRQTCLGSCETEEHFPRPQELAKLAAQFTGVRFNLALAVPLLASKFTPTDPLIRAGVESAAALATSGRPHLRLVDPYTDAQQTVMTETRVIADNLASLAREFAAQGGILSIENSRQPWKRLVQVLDEARKSLGTQRSSLRLCYDPCNLLSAEDQPAPGEVTRSLKGEELSMVHSKQRRNSTPWETVDAGEINWPDQLAALTDIGYNGPLLLEIPPNANIWTNLDESRAYLESISQPEE